jgi:hypothetical protein
MGVRLLWMRRSLLRQVIQTAAEAVTVRSFDLYHVSVEEMRSKD